MVRPPYLFSFNCSSFGCDSYRLLPLLIDVARALQRNRIRRLRSALLLRLWLRPESGGFRGFAGVAVFGTADWVHHTSDVSASVSGNFRRDKAAWD